MLIHVDVEPGLALMVAEAVERYRQYKVESAKLNGGPIPVGLAEIRDLYLSAAKSRQEPPSQPGLVSCASNS